MDWDAKNICFAVAPVSWLEDNESTSSNTCLRYCPNPGHAPIERATQISVPTQIIVGEKSPSSMQDVARQLTKAIPNATFVQLVGQDHMVNAKKLLPLLSGFFK
ncbi:MAG: alpha/beta fold hydrolase [Neobacillus sp.]|jgi:pimeloyl-ACP methyl ester carboxylesterase|nr:alpha/beta fold hydrolase [Neobacillus sp.]